MSASTRPVRSAPLDPALLPAARRAARRGKILFVLSLVDLAICLAGAYARHNAGWIAAFFAFLIFVLFTLGLWLASARRVLALERAAGHDSSGR